MSSRTRRGVTVANIRRGVGLALSASMRQQRAWRPSFTNKQPLYFSVYIYIYVYIKMSASQVLRDI